eukprot:1049893-Pyramimonas_sp.AAC.1
MNARAEDKRRKYEDTTLERLRDDVVGNLSCIHWCWEHLLLTRQTNIQGEISRHEEISAPPCGHVQGGVAKAQHPDQE